MLGAQQAGHSVEKVFLDDMQINNCTGCCVCYQTHKCEQHDDMADILDKMVSADVIVMATPVYFYTMNARMKTLIDRTMARYNEIRNKDFYFIVTAADTRTNMMKRAIESLRGFTEDCLHGAKEKGIVYGVGAWNVGDIKKSPSMQEAFEMGTKC